MKRTAFVLFSPKGLQVLHGPADQDLRNLRRGFLRSQGQPQQEHPGDRTLAVTVTGSHTENHRQLFFLFKNWLLDKGFELVDVRTADERKADRLLELRLNAPFDDLPEECNQPGIWE